MKRTALISIPFLLFISIFDLHSQSNDSIVEGISITRLQRFDDYIQQEIREGQIPGAVSLVMRNGVVVHQSAYGFRDIERQSPMETDAIFSVQSMTKSVVSVAFMMLYEEGKFQLTDPVSMYLPAFKDLRVIRNPDDGKNGETDELITEVTIFNLLTHTAGFGYGPFDIRTKLDEEYAEIWRDPHSHPNIAARVDAFLQLPLMNQPGAQWRYSISNDILSVLIERFSGMSTRDFLQERLFKPLKMVDTDYNVPAGKQSRVAQVYTYSEKEGLTPAQHNPPIAGNEIWQGKSGLFSTVADFKNFCEMLRNGGQYEGVRILSRKTVDLMAMNQTEDLFGWPGYGFGLGFAVLDDLADSKALGSEGLFYWLGAYNTHFVIDPAENLVALFFTQRRPFDRGYHQKMLQMVYQAIVD